MEICQLIQDLGDADVTKRRRAAEQLASRTDAVAVAVQLVRACGDPDEGVRQWASAALEQLGPPSPQDREALTNLLVASNDPDVRYWAVTLLGRLGAESASALPILLKVLTDDPALAVRERAVWACGKIGPKAGPCLGVLQEFAVSGTPRLARLAKNAISRIIGG